MKKTICWGGGRVEGREIVEIYRGEDERVRVRVEMYTIGEKVKVFLSCNFNNTHPLLV